MLCSDVAVDDLLFSNGACDEQMHCDFEDDFCGYSNTKQGDDFDWQIDKGRNLLGALGPRVDHTLATHAGHYAYVEKITSSFLQEGDKAWLISEVVHNPNATCLEWYMHFDGNYMFDLSEFANLTVYQKIAEGDTTKMNPLWTLSVTHLTR